LRGLKEEGMDMYLPVLLAYGPVVMKSGVELKWWLVCQGAKLASI
jgi:hypothetical protein